MHEWHVTRIRGSLWNWHNRDVDRCLHCRTRRRGLRRWVKRRLHLSLRSIAVLWGGVRVRHGGPCRQLHCGSFLYRLTTAVNPTDKPFINPVVILREDFDDAAVLFHAHLGEAIPATRCCARSLVRARWSPHTRGNCGRAVRVVRSIAGGCSGRRARVYPRSVPATVHSDRAAAQCLHAQTAPTPCRHTRRRCRARARADFARGVSLDAGGWHAICLARAGRGCRARRRVLRPVRASAADTRSFANFGNLGRDAPVRCARRNRLTDRAAQRAEARQAIL